MDHESIQSFLRNEIRDSGLSQKKLAAESKVPQPTISLFLSGKTHLDQRNIEKLLDYFGLETTLRRKQPTPKPEEGPAANPEEKHPPKPEARPGPERSKPDPFEVLFYGPGPVNVPERFWKRNGFH